MEVQMQMQMQIMQMQNAKCKEAEDEWLTRIKRISFFLDMRDPNYQIMTNTNRRPGGSQARYEHHSGRGRYLEIFGQI